MTESQLGYASFITGGGETGALLRSTDWSASRLGPASSWPQSLRTAVSICAGSRFPIAVYWGPEFLMLYNDDLMPMIGVDKHPWAMGRPALEILPEVRDTIGPLLQRVRDHGEAIWSEDTMLPLVGNATQEEAYFTFTYSPIQDESGGVGGVFCAALETTDKVIEGRRLKLLGSLGDATQGKTPAEVCRLAAAHLAGARQDLPFALLYLLDDASGAGTLVGAANLAAGSAHAPATIAAGDASIWPMDRACAQDGAPHAWHVVSLDVGTTGARGAVLLPIERAGGGRPLGVIVLGLSPLLRDAASYDRFHGLLATSISQAVSNAAAYQAERQRAESLAGPIYVEQARRSVVASTGSFQPASVVQAPAQARERIVIADDNADMREYVGRLLGERWDVELVSDGAAALATLRRNPPALVLCDVMMSEIDGFGLVREIRADPVLQSIPVIMLSARAGDDETSRGLDAGANDYISKPFSARDLLVRVASALATARTARDTREREMIQRGNLYRHFMQAPFPVCVFRGADHIIELANPPILRAWGKRPDIIGQPLLAAIPELHDQPFLGYLDGVFRTGIAFEGRAERALLPTGTDGAVEEVYFNFVYAALRDADGVIEGTLVSAFDVTDQVRARLERAAMLEDERQARGAAEAARSRLQSLFMQAPIPICILEGPEHRYTLANAPFLQLVGRPALVGTTVAESFPERVKQGVLTRLDQVYTSGEPYRGIEVPLRMERRVPGQLEDGLFNVVYEPFRDLEGQICGILAVLLDVTDATLAHRATEQARREAEDAAAAQRAMLDFQERFVAVLGHDLRNPLAAIDMATGLLAQQAARSDDATAIRVLTRLKSSSLRMSRMVDQILDLSRSRLGGGLTIAPAQMDLEATLTAVIDELRTAYPSRDIRLEGQPIVGTWDRDRLEQVFSNLIGNAIHHGVDGVPVTVVAEQDAETVRVTIHNHGPTIPDEVRAVLFDPFRRGKRDSRTAKTAGLGLGLYISHELVVAHGGSLDARSSADEGTTFQVTLPAKAARAVNHEVQPS